MSFSLTTAEFATLFAADLVICAVGFFIFRLWHRQGLVPPVWIVTGLLVASLALYVGVTRHLWLNADELPLYTEKWAAKSNLLSDRLATPEEAGLTEVGTIAVIENPKEPTRLMTVLIWCLAFWLVPVIYYSRVFLQAFSLQVIRRIEPFETEIPDWSEHADFEGYKEAQNLALIGDVEGAIDAQSHSRRRVRGCFAAARMHESNGKFAEAANLLNELEKQTKENGQDWAEAAYRLGNLYEKHLHAQTQAIDYFSRIVLRMPESEYGRMATNALRRLNPQGDVLLDALDASFELGPEDRQPSIGDLQST